MSESQSIIITPADAAFAAEVNAAERPSVDPLVTGEDIAAAVANRSGVVTICNGASIRVETADEPRTVYMHDRNAARAIVNEELASIGRRAQHHADSMNALLDPATGSPRVGFEGDFNRHAIALQSLQMAGEYQRRVAYPALSAKQQQNAAVNVDQMQREAAALDQRAQNDAAREFDRLFGRVSVR